VTWAPVSKRNGCEEKLPAVCEPLTLIIIEFHVVGKAGLSAEVVGIIQAGEEVRLTGHTAGGNEVGRRAHVEVVGIRRVERIHLHLRAVDGLRIDGEMLRLSVGGLTAW